MAREVIKVMVPSAAYGFKETINQICASISGYISKQYEYKVLNSHIGSIYVPPGMSPDKACLRAVDECDFFLGIILPRYGSGITHQGFERAIAQDKPRGFLSHFSVRFSRELLAQYMYSDIKARTKDDAFQFKKTAVFSRIPG